MTGRANHGRRVAVLVGALALAIVQRGEAQSSTAPGQIETVGVSGTGYDFPAISADGRYVAFLSGQQLDPADVNPSWFDIYVRDRQSGTTVLASKSIVTGVAGRGSSQHPSISADGRFVAFSSSAGDLVPDDTNDVDDIFLYDRDTDGNRIFDEAEGTRLTRVSVSSDGTQSNCVSARPSISGNGRYVAFDSCATNWVEVRGKTFAVQDIFVYDTETGLTIWANPPTLNSTNGFNNHHSGDASISGNGRYVAFESQATTQPTDIGHFGSGQIYVRDTCLGLGSACTPRTEWASPQAAVSGQPSDAFKPAISADGGSVAFDSRSTSMVPEDTNAETDIFVYDRAMRSVTRVNVSSTGGQAVTTQPTTCSGSLHASISGDGRLVTFESCANNLVADDTLPTNYQDVFVHDRDADGNGLRDEPGGISTTLVSRNPLGAPADSSSLYPAISSDGRVVVFSSFSRDITPGASPIGVYAWTVANRPPVANAGPDQTVTLSSPAGAVVIFDGSASSDPDGDPLTFTWSGPFGTLTGVSISPTLAPGTHIITLTVDDRRGGTAGDRVTVIVGGGTDLSISATASPDPVNTDADLTYSVVVTNGGPADATGVEVSIALPAYVAFVSGSGPQGPCIAPPAGTSGTARCSLGAIASGATVARSIVVRPTAPGLLALAVSGSGAEPDPNAANNSATASVTVHGPVVIEIRETIDVTDTPVIVPAALLRVDDTVTVHDTVNLVPSLLLGVIESITVTDTPGTVISGNTPAGTDVSVIPLDSATRRTPVKLTFRTVTKAGHTGLVIGAIGPPPPPGFAGGLPPRYDSLSTTAVFTGPVRVCASYAGTTFVGLPGLWHYEQTTWVNITTQVDAARQEVCGDTLSLSPFALFEAINRPPSLSLPKNLVVEATSAAGARASYNATASDPEDGSITPSCVPPSGSVFPLGTTAVSCSATDSVGGRASGSFTITVRDTTPPLLSLPAKVNAVATSAAGAVISYAATASDHVDGSIAPACSPMSGATYRIGTTTVACSATDAHGNRSTGSFAVIVKLGVPLVTGDVTAPGRGAGGTVFVDLTLTNEGNGHARGLRLTTIKFITLSGSGAVSYNAKLSGALPRQVGSVDAGAAAAPIRLYFNVPATVKRFSIVEAGTLENVIGTKLPFIAAQNVAVPR